VTQLRSTSTDVSLWGRSLKGARPQSFALARHLCRNPQQCVSERYKIQDTSGCVVVRRVLPIWGSGGMALALVFWGLY